jgi:CheY-like chemotaxis protein
MNLAVNARDAMPGGGELRIAIERIRVEENAGPLPDMPPGDWIRLTISDTGTGIHPDLLPHIFEPFFTTKAPKGTGLGLAQVYGIVKQHDGCIDVDTQIGQGTAFILYLPALSVSAMEMQLPQSQPLIEGEGQTILIVEDDAETRKALVDSLELVGYQTLAAKNGQEALTIWEQHTDEIALVLSDVVMPEMGGVALFYALRERDASIKMALLTGHLLEDQLGNQLEQLKAQGLVGWLQKPSNLEQLARFIARALNKDD